jgi:hypothetical protein
MLLPLYMARCLYGNSSVEEDLVPFSRKMSCPVGFGAGISRKYDGIKGVGKG